MKDYFMDLIEHNQWANTRIIQALKVLSEPEVKSLQLLSHIINVQDLWLERLKQVENPEIAVWDANSLQEIEILNMQSTSNWLKFLKKTNSKDLLNLCGYLNLKGEYFENTVQDIITQMLTHSHYHRGQINQLLRQSGSEPAGIDFILYARELKKK